MSRRAAPARQRAHRTAPRGAAGTRATALLGLAALAVTGAVVGTAAPAQALIGPTFVVTSVGDGADARRDGVCATAQGDCTLRAALAEAGAALEHATIAFSIAGVGPHTIVPAAALPALANPRGITIDGYTEPDARVNTAQAGSNAKIAVEIRGKGPAGFNVFSIATPFNVVRGLAIYDMPTAFSLSGDGADGNELVGNFVCTNAAGTFQADRVHTSGLGILLAKGASGNAIGKPGVENRNVVSGCFHRGVVISFFPSIDNRVQNNVIGLNPAGTAALPNRSHGVDVNYTRSNLIGGPGAGEGNVISGNAGAGVEISHSRNTNSNAVVGNLFGTNADGTAAPAYARNMQWGVRLEGPKFCGDPARPNPDSCTEAGVSEGLPHSNAVRDNVIVNNAKGGILIDKGQHDNMVSGNRIGLLENGTAAPNPMFGLRIERGSYSNLVAGNTIAFNPKGILISSTGSFPIGPEQRTYGNRITDNSIFSNSSLGIDLQPFGTPGASPLVQDGIAAPALTTAKPTVLTGTACGGCTVEVYVADNVTSGEGRQLIATGTAQAGGAFAVTIPSTALQTPLTALASDRIGNTSEFAKAVLVRA